MPIRLYAVLIAAASLPAFAEPSPSFHQSGTQYSPLKQITRNNVGELELAWEFKTGDRAPEGFAGLMAFEDQPSLIDGNLIVCSVKRKLTALDPATGATRWTFDPQEPEVTFRKCRGVGHWVDRQAEDDAPCRSRLFLGTVDYRLLAIDSKTGKACADFGDRGVVQMPPSKPVLWPGEVAATSNPAVVNDVVVVGSAVADNQRVDSPSGRVLAFDARSGAARWAFDPVPRDAEDPAMASWRKGTEGIGQGNVWSSMAADNALDLVYLPTTSPSSDFYGAIRPGDNHYTSSVVTLRGSTGEVVWHQQLTHHNVWDYDVPSRPMLIDYPGKDGAMVPALLQNTKMGLVFIFDRATGEPLVPIEERPVPQDGKLAGEVLSPTQPFPVGMPALMPQSFSPDDAWGFSFIDKWLCQRETRKYTYGPIYTPITEQGTIVVPSVGGGPNWGGGGYDPASHIMVVPTNRVPIVVSLTPSAKVAGSSGEISLESAAGMSFKMDDSPYVFNVKPLLSPLGSPCSAPPWAALTAIDIVDKKIVWEVPLGDIGKMMPMKPPAFLNFNTKLGTPGAGGPLVTAGGLVFIGYTLDDTFRAFDLHTGKTLWETALPAAGTSVPVSYEVNGEQYVVIPAGGHTMYQSTMGDSVMAYKLKRGGAKP